MTSERVEGREGNSFVSHVLSGARTLSFRLSPSSQFPITTIQASHATIHLK
jgi:hypothetical protein